MLRESNTLIYGEAGSGHIASTDASCSGPICTHPYYLGCQQNFLQTVDSRSIVWWAIAGVGWVFLVEFVVAKLFRRSFSQVRSLELSRHLQCWEASASNRANISDCSAGYCKILMHNIRRAAVAVYVPDSVWRCSPQQ